MFEVRIGRHKHGEVFLLGRVQQLSILKPRPSALVCGGNFVLRQRVTQRFRSTLIKQCAHLGSGERATRGVVQHRTNLFESDPGKPVYKLGHKGAVLKILEQRRHGHAGAAEYPGATDAFRVALNGRAR